MKVWHSALSHGFELQRLKKQDGSIPKLLTDLLYKEVYDQFLNSLDGKEM